MSFQLLNLALINMRVLPKGGFFHPHWFLKVVRRRHAMNPAKVEEYYENAFKKTFKNAPITEAHKWCFGAPLPKTSIERDVLTFLEKYCNSNLTDLQSFMPWESLILWNIFQCYAGVLTLHPRWKIMLHFVTLRSEPFSTVEKCYAQHNLWTNPKTEKISIDFYPNWVQQFCNYLTDNNCDQITCCWASHWGKSIHRNDWRTYYFA